MQALGVIAACGLAFAACGTSSTPAISAGVSATLAKQAAAVRAAATNHDVAGARQQLAQLRAEVSASQGQGHLSASRAAEILAAASQVDTQLNTLAPATVAAPATTPAVAVHAPVTSGRGGEKKGKKKGGGD
jgi:glutamine cyclotransferase